MAGGGLRGPARFLAAHPAAMAAAAFGAAFGAAAFALRARRSRGAWRAAWLALSAFQVVQLAGILGLGARAKAAAGADA